MATPPASSLIRIGTRSSELALRQARLVQAALETCGVASELVTYRTVGDKRLDESLSSIGAKGLFTKELEQDLLKGKTQIAVHSLKDLPTESPPGLIVAAVLQREDPRDALVVNGRILAQSLGEHVVITLVPALAIEAKEVRMNLKRDNPLRIL